MSDPSANHLLASRLLNDFQQNFPICPAPFVELAERLGVAESAVLRMLEQLRREGKPVFIGLDLASKIDIAAKIYVFKKGEVYYVFSQYYIPEDRTFDEDSLKDLGLEL